MNFSVLYKWGYFEYAHVHSDMNWVAGQSARLYGPVLTTLMATFLWDTKHGQITVKFSNSSHTYTHVVIFMLYGP